MMNLGADMSNPATSVIVKRYKDASGTWRKTTEETCSAILDAMGQQESNAEQPLLVVRRGQRKRIQSPAEVTLEDGTVLRVETTLPSDLPLGYHTLRSLDTDDGTRLIVSPGCCYLPEQLRVWVGRFNSMLCAPTRAGVWGISRICRAWPDGRQNS